MTNIIIQKIKEFNDKKYYEQGLLYIYDQFDTLNLNKNFKQVDELISEVIKNNFNIQLLLGVYVMTLPFKSKLKRFRMLKSKLESLGDFNL